MTYEPTGLARSIFIGRYGIHEQEIFAYGGAATRVSYQVASAEVGEAREIYAKAFEEEIAEGRFMPGGRIMYGAGRPKGQLLNCFVVPTSDSREGWGKTVSDMIVICGTGGGLGVNGSPVRPRGTPIAGSGGVGTGSVSLMEIINSAGEQIKAGGGRRTALMLALNIGHGDIVEFLDAKLDLDRLNNANVSVVFDSDPEDFFASVRAGETFKLTFRGREVGSIPAAELWEKILTNALRNGEPGLLNGHYANKMSNIGYHAPLICTNPCGEIWLTAYDCCCLGALVLPRFVHNSGLELQWHELASSVRLAVRFLDDVLTVNNYPLPEIAQTCSDIRRIGLGVMGLHDMLLQMGLKYNSPEGLEFVDKVMRFIKDEAYLASIDLAKEKGPFPKFDADQYLRGGFAKTLKPSIRKAIKEHGIRNCALLTIAPTGTTSMVQGVSSGIEPLFAAAYLRRYRDGERLAEETVIHPLFAQFVAEGRDTSHFQDAHDLTPRDHLEMQRVCQRHVDNAVSKTINLPPGTPLEELSALYMEYFPELKGVTIYPEGSRENQPLTPLTLEQAMGAAGDALLGTAGVDACKSGECDV